MLKEQLESARLAIGMVTVTMVVGGTISPTSARKFDAPDSRAAQMLDAYANLPVAFVENRGQTDARVRLVLLRISHNTERVRAGHRTLRSGSASPEEECP
jgi:hypothetical protein